MSDVVKELLGAGVVDSRGVFTVDAEKAQEKLERFRLADPLGYVVELVQAAGLSGATHVDVEVTASLFRLRFDGRAFTVADLTDLESAVLVRNDVDHPARQQLALGVSAARALDPRFVSVRSVAAKLILDDEGARVVTSEAGSPDDAVAAPLPPPFTTVVEVQESFRIGHFVEFFEGAFGKQKEERMLADRCRHARFKVSVNGVVVSGQPAPCELQVDVIDDDRAGSFGFRLGSLQPGRLLLLRAGVVQEEIVFADESACSGLHVPRGFVALVDAPHLPRDASFTRFIRNDAFNALLRWCATRCRQAAPLLTSLGQRLSPLELEEHRDWTHAIARDVLAHMGPEGRTTTNKQLAGLRALPLLTDVLGAPLTLDALIEDAARHGHAATMTTRRKQLNLKPARPVVLVDPEVEAWMERLGVRLRDATADVDEADQREQSQSQFRARRSSCTLPSGAWAEARFDVSATELGVIGFRQHGADAALITVLVDGCELAQLTIPFAVPGLTIVVQGPFTPTFGYDDVVRNAALGQALARAAGAIPLLFEGGRVRSPTARERAALTACMGLFLDGNVLAAALLDAVGCPKVALDLSRLDPQHAAGTTRLLPTLGGDEVSLDQLISGEGPIGVVGVDAVDFSPSLRPTLRSGEVLRAVLRKVVPLRPLVSLNDEATQARRRIELRGRSPEGLALTETTARVPVQQRVEVERPEQGAAVVAPIKRSVSGFVGYRPAGPRGKIELNVFSEGRKLHTVKLPSPVTGLVASLNDDHLPLTGKLQHLGSVEHLVDVALSAVPKLLGALNDPWPLASEVIDCLLPTQEHRAGLARLQANLPPAELGAAWEEVLSLSSFASDGDVAAALELVLAEDAVPTVDRVAAVVGGKALMSLQAQRKKTTTEKTTTTTDPRLRLLAPVLGHEGPLLPKLLSAFGLDDVAIRRLDGSHTTLPKLLDPATKLRTIPEKAPYLEGFGDVVVLPPTLLAVVRRLRDGPIEDARAAMAVVAARLAFEQKQTVLAAIGRETQTVARLDIVEDGLRGEVALLAGPGSSKPLAELLLLHKGKHLARLAIGKFVGVSLLAVIDADDVTPTANFDDVVHDPRLTAVIDRVRAAREELVTGLVDKLGGGDVGAVAVRARLLERLRIGHTDKRRSMPSTGLVGRIADLHFFPTVGGDRVPLRDQGGDDDRVRYVTMKVRPADVPPGFEDVVVVERAAERELLEKTIDVEDVERAWIAAARLHETRRRLPALSTDIVDNGLVEHAVQIGKASLRLALPRVEPGQTRLVLRVGHDGLLVETLSDPDFVPCQGVLTGETVVAKDLGSARVDDKLKASVAREAGALWTKAVDRFKAIEDGSDDDDDRRLLRSWLRQGALWFGDADLEPTGTVPGWKMAVRARLLQVRVLPCSGGFISLATAMQEQPPELVDLLRRHGLLRGRAVVVPAPVTSSAPPTRAPKAPPKPEPKPVVVVAKPQPPPEPPPEPKPPTDAERLHERLVSVIGVVRDRAAGGLTSDLQLHRVRVVSSKSAKLAARIDVLSGTVVVDLGHPVARAALDDGPALAMLASLVVTRINERLEAVSDDDERRFLSSLIAHARTLEGR